jgi:hypothetical protein
MKIKPLKIAALALALMMVLAACNGAAPTDNTSANNTPTDVSSSLSGENTSMATATESPEPVELKMTLGKPEFNPGERITVTVTGITEEMENADAFIALYDADAPHGDWKERRYLGAGSASPDTFTFNALGMVGDYEIRLFGSDDGDSDASLVLAAAFAVSWDGANITLEKTDYDVYEDIIVTITGITEEMENNGAFVGIFKPGEWHFYPTFDPSVEVQKTQGSKHIGVKAGTSTVTFDDVYYNREAGDYEIRLYSYNTANQAENEEAFVIKVPYTVSYKGYEGREELKPEMTTDKTIYEPGETITVTVTGCR